MCGVSIYIRENFIEVVDCDLNSFIFNSILQLNEKFVVLGNTDLDKTIRLNLSQILNSTNNLIDFFTPFTSTYISQSLEITNNTLPLNLSNSANLVLLDLFLTSDLDISSWQPSGLIDGSLVRIRKMSTDSYKISWNQYSFLNKQYEFITLIWHNNRFDIV